MSSDSGSDSEIDRIVEKSWEKVQRVGKAKISKTKIGKGEIEEIPQPQPVAVAKAIKPRKARGPATEAQKKALAAGRIKRDRNNELRKLEKEQGREIKKDKIKKLKKIKAIEDDTDGADEMLAMKAELAEMKKQMGGSKPVNIPKPEPVIDKAKEIEKTNLQNLTRRYLKF